MADPPKDPPNLAAMYGRAAIEVTPGAFAFDLRLLRPGGRTVKLLPACESVSWRDGSEVTASLALRRPAGAHRPDSLPAGEGHTAVLRYRWVGGWLAAWRLRLGRPGADPISGQVTVDLADEFWPLRRETREWVFRKTRKRGRGWYPGEVAEYVCRELGVRAGRIARGRHRIDELEVDGTGLEAIRAAYKKERDRTADRFRIRLTDRLDVSPFHRPGTLLVVGDHVRGAQLDEQRRDATPATVIKAVGRVGAGRDARTVKATVSDERVVGRFGRREATRRLGKVDSLAELRARAMVELAEQLDVRRGATLEVPGVPWIGRGDGMRWRTTEPGFRGSTRDMRDRSFVWVTDAEHVLSGDGYTMTLTIDQRDPWTALRERQDRERRRIERKSDDDEATDG